MAASGFSEALPDSDWIRALVCLSIKPDSPADTAQYRLLPFFHDPFLHFLSSFLAQRFSKSSNGSMKTLSAAE